MADEKITIDIELEVAKQVDARFKKLEKKAKKSGTKAGRGFEKGFKKSVLGSISSVKTQLLGLGAVFGSIFAIKGAVQAAAGFEKIKTQLETLTGSAAAASVVFEELKEFSSETPFQLQDIARASAKLISFGISAGEVRDQMREIGEVAAGSGSDLGDLSLIFGQVQAASKLTGERLLQLQERAIPIGPAIAKSMGVAESAVKDLVSEGKVTAAEFNKAFTAMTTDGGIFAGSLKKQSQTLDGVFSTLTDNFTILQASVGKTFSASTVKLGKEFTKVFKELTKTVENNSPLISSYIDSLSKIFILKPAKGLNDFLKRKNAEAIRTLNGEIETLSQKLIKLRGSLSPANSSFEQFKKEASTVKALQTTLDGLIERRKELLGLNNAETKSIKAKLKAQAKARQDALKEAERTKAQQDSLKALGQIGLGREQIIRANAEKELEIIRASEATKAIELQEAFERSSQVVANREAQLTAIKEQEMAKRTAARKAALESELASEQTLSDKLGNVSKRFAQVGKDFRITSNDIAKSLIGGFGNAAGSAFSAFGAALVKGENALKAFGKAFAAAIGQQMVTLGTRFILEGIAVSFSPFLGGPAVGGPLIAAGAALATVGGTLGALLGGGGDAGGGGGVGASTGGGIGNDGGFGDSTAQAEELEEPDTRVAITIQGDVFDSDETGLRISQILEQASLNQNVTVVGAA